MRFVNNASYNRIPKLGKHVVITMHTKEENIFWNLTERHPWLQAEAVSAFWSGGWQIASEASRKFLPPPCEFSPPPCRGVSKINPQTYKHRADIWLTYCYISSSLDISSPFRQKHCKYSLYFSLKEHLSLNCLWYDLIPGPYLSCLCVKATSVYIHILWQFKIWTET